MIKNPYMEKHDEDCKCCHGTGIQRNSHTGMNQECPCCGGTGKKKNASGTRKIWMG